MPSLPLLGAALPAVGPMQAQDQQPQGPPTSLGSIHAQLEAARRRQALAQALQTSGYVPNSGPMGAVAQMFAAHRGNSLEKRAGETIAEALERKFTEEARIQADKEAREAARELEKEDRTHVRQLDLKRAPGWESDPTSVREYRHAKDDPRYAAFLDADRASRGTKVTVNSGPQGPQATKFQEALGSKQADQFVTWQQDAVAANEVKQKVAQLREISALQKTGKLQEAQALVGQYFGTQAAANMQAFNAMTGPMVIELASKLKPLSNSDIEFVKTTVPRFGNDPRANQRILDMLEGAADRQVQLYDKAATYAEANRSLDGFRPGYGEPKREAPAAAARPTATNAQGVKVEWNGKAWVRAQP